MSGDYLHPRSPEETKDSYPLDKQTRINITSEPEWTLSNPPPNDAKYSIRGEGEGFHTTMYNPNPKDITHSYPRDEQTGINSNGEPEWAISNPPPNDAKYSIQGEVQHSIRIYI